MLTLNQVREGSGLPPMAKHTSLTRVPVRMYCPSWGPSIHSFWAGSSERQGKRRRFCLKWSLRVRVGTPEDSLGSRLERTFHIQGE